MAGSSQEFRHELINRWDKTYPPILNVYSDMKHLKSYYRYRWLPGLLNMVSEPDNCAVYIIVLENMLDWIGNINTSISIQN